MIRPTPPLRELCCLSQRWLIGRLQHTAFAKDNAAFAKEPSLFLRSNGCRPGRRPERDENCGGADIPVCPTMGQARMPVPPSLIYMGAKRSNLMYRRHEPGAALRRSADCLVVPLRGTPRNDGAAAHANYFALLIVSRDELWQPLSEGQINPFISGPTKINGVVVFVPVPADGRLRAQGARHELFLAVQFNHLPGGFS